MNEVLLTADEIDNCGSTTCEFTFHNRAVLNTIMGYNENKPIEKFVKVALEDFSDITQRVLATGKFDLATVINKANEEGIKSVYEDISLSQNLGLMRLRITPKKIELREKVTKALTKPPVPMKINKMPVSPSKFADRSGSFTFESNTFNNLNLF